MWAGWRRVLRELCTSGTCARSWSRGSAPARRAEGLSSGWKTSTIRRTSPARRLPLSRTCAGSVSTGTRSTCSRSAVKSIATRWASCANEVLRIHASARVGMSSVRSPRRIPVSSFSTLGHAGGASADGKMRRRSSMGLPLPRAHGVRHAGALPSRAGRTCL